MSPLRNEIPQKGLDRIISYGPWLGFLFFLTSTLILQDESVSLLIKLEIAFCGLLVPFLAMLLVRESGGPLTDLFLLRSPSRWFFWAGWGVVMAGIGLRFYHLISLSGWLLPDEGNYIFQAMRLSERNDWGILYGPRQHPPLFYWLFGLYFKMVPPSLGSVWGFTALISAGALLLGFWAFRFLGSGSFSFLCIFSLATGFWPLFIGRICFNYGLTFLWEFLALGCLGIYQRRAGEGKGSLYAGVFGLVLGLGLFTFVLWALFAAVMACVFYDITYGKNPKAWKAFLFSFTPFFILFLSLYATHPQALLGVSGLDHGWDPGRGFLRLGAYLQALFWKGRGFSYGPLWGGLLNPVWSAFFLVGLSVLVRNYRQPLGRWLLLVLVILLLPTLFSEDLETFRILYLIPFLIGIGALGAVVLARSFSATGGKILVGFLALFGSFFDVGQLLGPYHDQLGVLGVGWKSMGYYEAYQDLRAFERQDGAGLVLTDLSPLNDKVVAPAVYSFDGLQNPRISPGNLHWAAVLIRNEYVPFLTKRFPQARWYRLGGARNEQQAVWVLGRIPLDAEDRDVVERWAAADQAFRNITDMALINPWADHRANLPLNEALLGQDPFLWSCYLEKRVLEDMLVLQDYPDCLTSLEKYMKRAYPLPQLIRIRDRLRARVKITETSAAQLRQKGV